MIRYYYYMADIDMKCLCTLFNVNNNNIATAYDRWGKRKRADVEMKLSSSS